MVKQTQKNIADDINKLNENEPLAVSEYIFDPPSNRTPYSKDNSKSDDLIVSLSDAYENKRARQVFEWESIRRKSFQKAA
jgi:hypothetical protein